MKLSIKVAQYRHRLLRWCSASYRAHDAVVSDRERWRVQCVTAGNDLSDARSQIRVLNESIEKLHAQVRAYSESCDSVNRQLAAERALRQSADARAERYHEELVETLKASANWSTKSLNRRSMYPEVDTPEPEQMEQKPPEAFRPKPFARQVAKQVTDSTLRAVLEDIRNGRADEVQIGQVGPEFTSAG